MMPQFQTLGQAGEGKGPVPQAKVLLACLGCLAATGTMYHFVAGQEFSSVLTVSAFFQCLSFVFILIQIYGSQSVAGISGRTFAMQAVMLGFRLSSTLFLEGYLPMDKSGDMIYQIADVLSLLMVLKVLHCVYTTHQRSYDASNDTFDVKTALVVCGALAVVVHPPLNDWATFDIAWAASLYIDTVAFVPQLLMCSKVGQVPAYTAHYLMAQLVSRFFSAWFWYYGAENIARLNEGGGICWSAAFVMLAHVLQFVCLADFGYYYARAYASGALRSQEQVDLSSLVHEI